MQNDSHSNTELISPSEPIPTVPELESRVTVEELISKDVGASETSAGNTSITSDFIHDSTEVNATNTKELSVTEAFNLLRPQSVSATTDFEITESFPPTCLIEETSADDKVLPFQDPAAEPIQATDETSVQDSVSSCDEVVYATSAEVPSIQVNWLHCAPKLIAHAEKDYRLMPPKCSSDNYLRGCMWSPDGSCILTNSRDNVLRLFNLPGCLFTEGSTDSDLCPEEMSAVLTMREHELVYDYAWYPTMRSSDPATCCFASTVRRNPIRLWDAFTGEVRATYRPINHLGELISAYSIAFSADGQRLYAGFNRFMHVFDVGRPGRDSMRRPKLGKKPTQGGIISCIAVPNHSGRQVYATGSYNGSVVVYAEPGNPIVHLDTGSAGVTQVQFTARVGHETGSPWYLAAGSRMDSRVFLWDARQVKKPLLVVHRRVENHQRFQFDFDPLGGYLFTGNQTGAVCVYNLSTCLENYHACQLVKPSLLWRAHSDCAHGLSVNPTLPIVATSSGQRRIRPPAILTRRTKKQKISETAAQSGVHSIISPNPTSSGGEGHQSSSDSESNSSIFEAELTDEEASLISAAQLDETTVVPMATGVRSLPLSGKLTRLPRENRLCLWSFPTVTGELEEQTV